MAAGHRAGRLRTEPRCRSPTLCPLPPARLLDTRPGQPTVDGAAAGAGLTAADSTLVLQVTGRGGVPDDAAAVVLNVTADGAQGSGYVTVYPCDAERPLASSVNFVAGTPVPNAVITKLSATGTVCLYVAVNAVNLIADVSGYFPAASGYNGLTPARLLDTRAGQSTVDGAQLGAGLSQAGSTVVLPVAGRGGVPDDADAVVLNVTADGAHGPGYVTVYRVRRATTRCVEPQLRRWHPCRRTPSSRSCRRPEPSASSLPRTV